MGDTMPARTPRGYWAAVLLVNVVVFVVIAEWALTTHNPWIFAWNAVLVSVAGAVWRYRTHRYAAGVAMAAPILVMLATGLSGRWPFALFSG